jgi:hypothetical protein
LYILLSHNASAFIVKLKLLALENKIITELGLNTNSALLLSNGYEVFDSLDRAEEICYTFNNKKVFGAG